MDCWSWRHFPESCPMQVCWVLPNYSEHNNHRSALRWHRYLELLFCETETPFYSKSWLLLITWRKWQSTKLFTTILHLALSTAPDHNQLHMRSLLVTGEQMPHTFSFPHYRHCLRWIHQSSVNLLTTGPVIRYLDILVVVSMSYIESSISAILFFFHRRISVSAVCKSLSDSSPNLAKWQWEWIIS